MPTDVSLPFSLHAAEVLTAAVIGDDPARARVATARLARLGRRWGAQYRAAGAQRGHWRRTLARTDALAVAHVLATAQLPAAELAPLVDRALTAWCFGTATSRLDARAPASRRTPEVLLGALTACPPAARRVLAGWEPEALDLLLGWDASAVGPFLLAATPDGDGDGRVTGTLLEAVVATVWRSRWDAARPAASGQRLVMWVARLVAPWQLHLMAASPGWDWCDPDPLTLLRWLAAHSTQV